MDNEMIVRRARIRELEDRLALFISAARMVLADVDTCGFDREGFSAPVSRQALTALSLALSKGEGE